MSKLKFLFDLEEDEDLDKPEDLESNKLLSLSKHGASLQSQNFLEKMLSFLPTPEEELENVKKDEESLTSQVNELKQCIEKINIRLEEIKESSDSEEFEVLNNKKEQYSSLLDTYEADLSYASAQKKSLGYLIDDTEEGDEKFEAQLPELFANTYVSTKKKMEDVNSVVNILELQAKKNKIEMCIECDATFRDENGRKTSLKHFHLEGFEDLKKYKPILCIDCFQAFKCSKNGLKCANEELKNIEFEEDNSDGSNGSDGLCKRGNKIFNSKNILNSPEFKEKGKKFVDLENQDFVENIRNKGKKSLFDSFF
jgi:hypothetical protein